MADSEDKRGRGRPAGKKSDPDYTTLTVYIRKATLKEVKKRCIDQDTDVSMVVQELLTAWLLSDIQNSEKLDSSK